MSRDYARAEIDGEAWLGLKTRCATRTPRADGVATGARRSCTGTLRWNALGGRKEHRSFDALGSFDTRGVDGNTETDGPWGGGARRVSPWAGEVFGVILCGLRGTLREDLVRVGESGQGTVCSGRLERSQVHAAPAPAALASAAPAAPVHAALSIQTSWSNHR